MVDYRKVIPVNTNLIGLPDILTQQTVIAIIAGKYSCETLQITCSMTMHEDRMAQAIT